MQTSAIEPDGGMATSVTARYLHACHRCRSKFCMQSPRMLRRCVLFAVPLDRTPHLPIVDADVYTLQWCHGCTEFRHDKSTNRFEIENNCCVNCHIHSSIRSAVNYTG